MASRGLARQKMIETALDLFHRFGVNGTSVDHILKKSKTGKSQFAHYFKNKDGLIHETLQHLSDVVRGGCVDSNYEIKNWKDFESWFQNYIDFQKSVKFERSCPFGTIGADLSNEQELLRQDLRVFLKWTRFQFSNFFEKQQANGSLSPSTDPVQLADLCLTVMQGGMLLTKMNRSSGMFENASNQVIAYVRSLRTLKGRKN